MADKPVIINPTVKGGEVVPANAGSDQTSKPVMVPALDADTAKQVNALIKAAGSKTTDKPLEHGGWSYLPATGTDHTSDGGKELANLLLNLGLKARQVMVVGGFTQHRALRTASELWVKANPETAVSAKKPRVKSQSGSVQVPEGTSDKLASATKTKVKANA